MANGDVLQPILVLAEHRGDASDGVDVVDLVDLGQDLKDQAAAAVIVDTLGIQFHGSNSSSRWAGWVAILASVSASQACGSTLFILAVTIRLYIAAAR
jgi:hypothetical protein